MRQFTLILLFSFLSFCLSCGVSMCGSGGGGGGCGCQQPQPCCCSPPPQPCCGGGCGRKKRSVETTELYVLVSSSDDGLCNSPRLKKILNENLKSTPAESKSAITAAAGEDIFAVICSDQVVSYAVDHDAEFCSSARDNVTCQIFGK